MARTLGRASTRWVVVRVDGFLRGSTPNLTADAAHIANCLILALGTFVSSQTRLGKVNASVMCNLRGCHGVPKVWAASRRRARRRERRRRVLHYAQAQVEPAASRLAGALRIRVRGDDLPRDPPDALYVRPYAHSE